VCTDKKNGLERSVLLPLYVCVCVAVAIELGVVCVVACESSVFFVPSCVLYTVRQDQCYISGMS
jgi:hypothetical protein